jgi:hypothetical protein
MATTLRPTRIKQSFGFDEIPSQESLVEHCPATAWKRLIRDYSRWDLTVARDKLPAISGLASWFSRNLHNSEKDSYLAGLWKSQLPETLLWYHKLPILTNASRPTNDRAPSWSWASLDCKYLAWFEFSSLEDRFMHILECVITCQTANIFGEAAAGYLKIRAPMKRGWLLPNNLWNETYDSWGEDSKTEKKRRFPGQLETSLG